jgi:hypothetical protein
LPEITLYLAPLHPLAVDSAIMEVCLVEQAVVAVPAVVAPEETAAALETPPALAHRKATMVALVQIPAI